jgi:hypothetical protein
METTTKKYQITETDKFHYVGLVLLNEIINFQHYFPVYLTGDDVVLGDYLKNMASKGLLEIKHDKYIPTAKGREELINLYAKYYEYLKMFDIFCAVDLKTGEFAFARMLEAMNDEEWKAYLNQERFSDVRVAVADFKKMNPVSIVFMSFLNEGRFDCTVPSWQTSLTGLIIWQEIEEICNTAISTDYLIQDGVLEDVIKQGAELAIKLIKDAEEVLKQPEEESSEPEETVTETTTEEYVDIVELPTYSYGYWDPFYDPYYISPLWLVPVLMF